MYRYNLEEEHKPSEAENEYEWVDAVEWEHNGATYFVVPETDEVMTEDGEVVGTRKQKFIKKEHKVKWFIEPVE